MFPWHDWFSDLCTGLLAYLLTSALAWLGISFGIDFVRINGEQRNTPRTDFLNACCRFDGDAYAAITEKGYSYDPVKRSRVAFFPAYPLAARLIIAVTGSNVRLALFVVSNLALLGAFVVFSAYLRSRCPLDTPRKPLVMLSLFGVWPAGFFFRVSYSESTLLFFTLLVLCGMFRRWPLPVLIFFSGAATAARPVGLAVTAALAWHTLSDANRGAIFRRLLVAGVCSMAASWGLIAYMTYQYYEFDNPLAFAQTQEHWSYLAPSQTNLGDKVASLLAAEPIWGVYTSNPIRSWKRLDPHHNLFFNLFFWNPIMFVVAFALVLFGAAKSWLTGPEIVLSLGLLGIPYVTRAYEMSMASHARFASVVVPAYFVLGRLLVARPEWLRWCVFGFLSTMLMTWSALFAAGYLFF